ncbi:hypothetical protein [Desulfosporosinus sp. FKB]|uniref:hypothetical protein n=1 Tax=Desulfosporosinus sp. FKB TaxID=1969835 RepID=UPI000B49A355|nr:hypothetical protein [Desulfosporosinus sp. FKB]
MQDTLEVNQKLVSHFQQIMQRVWCDNSLINGLEEVQENLEQIIKSAEASKVVLSQLSKAHKEALQKDWDLKYRVLENFLVSMEHVLKQFQEERQQLRGNGSQ